MRREKAENKHLFCIPCYTRRDEYYYQQVEKKASSEVIKQKKHFRLSFSCMETGLLNFTTNGLISFLLVFDSNVSLHVTQYFYTMMLLSLV